MRHRALVAYCDLMKTPTKERLGGPNFIRLPDGTLVTLQLSPKVQNLDQLKPGDHVLAKYFEASLVHVKKSPDAPVAEAAVEAS